MITWIALAVLYLAALFAFDRLGGLLAAGKSMEEWGRYRTG